MMLAQLGLGYLGIGVVAAVTLLATRRVGATDGVLVILLWPIWAPLALARGEGPGVPAIETRIRELTDHAAEVAALRRQALAKLQSDAVRLRGELAQVEQRILEYDHPEVR